MGAPQRRWPPLAPAGGGNTRACDSSDLSPLDCHRACSSDVPDQIEVHRSQSLERVDTKTIITLTQGQKLETICTELPDLKEIVPEEG
jgi:hypothetical protein